MKIFKTSIIFLFCLAWIFATNYKYFPINSIGTLLTYKSGLLSVPIDKNYNYCLDNKDFHLQIFVDDIGIPHIYSNKKTELAFGLGYMHAKDRYFQMELTTRTVLGELSEVFGKQTISSDKVWKPYEFNRISIELLEELKKTNIELYKYLVAYSKGVNYYLKNNKQNDPMYKIFKLEPRKWQPEYSLLITWYLSGNLSYFDYHVQQQEIFSKLPKKIIDAFYPLNPKGLNTILSRKKSKNDFQKEIFEKKEIVSKKNIDFDKDVGSNNWTVNSHKTDNKGSILLNDPHMYLTLPNAFYESHMVSENLKIYGYSIPGVPIIVSGHNDKVAWGITNGEWDLTDRYLLQVKNDSLYYYQDNWIPFEKKKFTIIIRGKGKEIFHQKRTVHGKVIKEDSTYYAQKWYPSDKTYSIESLFNLMQSDDWDSFNESLREYDYPPQNFIYSDIYDNIGIVCAGKLPKREKSYFGGLLDGSKKPINSQKIDSLWYDFNPKKNYLFSANQQPIQNDFYFGGHWHKDDFRVNRISQLLNNENNWSVKKMKQMQLDQIDVSIEEFKKLINNYSISNKYQYIIDDLKNWDGLMSSESQQALYYEIFRESILQESKKYANTQLKVLQKPSFKYFIKYLNTREFIYPSKSNKQIIVNNIFKRTDSILKSQFIDEKYKSKCTFFINSISFLPGFGENINDMGGNKNTINMNASTRPVFRSIIELNKNNIKEYTILAGGQSGKINSVNYKDQLVKWEKGLYRETQFVNNPKKLNNIVSTIIFE